MNVYTYVIVGMSASFILASSLLLFFVKYKRNLLKQQYELKEKEVQHQKTLLYTIISSQEAERKRIGMDLHDEVGANLSSLRLMIENFTEKNEKISSIHQFNEQTKNVIDHIITNTRNISHNLSPLLNMSYGFQDMVYDYCDGINSSGRIWIQLTFDEDKPLKLDDNVGIILYRVITELINNTIKHARAKLITLCFSFSDGLYIMNYQDDGIGLVSGYKKGMGLQNIESRLGMVGANYHIANNNSGFNLSLTLPI